MLTHLFLLTTLVTLSDGPSTIPSTVPVPATMPGPVDTRQEIENVKAAATEFAKALGSGDAAKAKAMYVGPAGDVLALEGLCGYAAAINHLAASAGKQFGPASPLSRPKSPGATMAIAIIDSECKLDGDNATLILAGGRTTMSMARRQGAWKVSGLSELGLMALNAARLAGVTKVMEDLASEISQGKFPNSSAAEAELNKRARAVASQAASRPSR